LSENIITFVEPKLFQLFIMKKHILTLCLLFISVIVFAGKFVLIPVTDTQNLETLFAQNDVKIHHYCDDYVLATTDNLTFKGTVVLDEHAFGDVETYAIVYCMDEEKEEYLKRIAGSVKVLHSGNNHFIMKLIADGFMPAKNDGMKMVRDIEVIFSKTRFDYPVITEIDPIILSLLNNVSKDSLMATVQHLQDYETRRCDHPNSVLAQNWIKNRYESLGLPTMVHTFPAVYPWWGGSNKAGNVIAIQYGTEFPDEYIVCGGHYDSFAYMSPQGEPGADDNATGTAGIFEIARILKDYNFKRSIIYCSFAAEECGLYGSHYYAQQCSNQGMNILGYFNIDMSGYLAPGATKITISIIRPAMAIPLDNYYTNIANIYFPEVNITHHTSMYGDSDHSSFCEYGYQGIYPFENNSSYSPYIHTSNDKIGQSVNNPEQVSVYTKISLGCIATLAILDGETPQFPPPTDCKAEYLEGMKIKITWEKPEETGAAYLDYIVYRDSVYIGRTDKLEYVDTVTDFEEHCYNIIAIYNGVNPSEYSNKSCAAVPIFPPTDCAATFFEDKSIKITWSAPAEVKPDKYSILRDNVPIAQQKGLSYIDIVEDYLEHCYKITALYGDKESDYSNESCASGLIVKEHSSSFTVVPNPTTGELTIDNGQLTIEGIEIYDVYGRIVKGEGRKEKGERETVINISHLPTGTYFLKISTNKTAETVKIVKL